jgi:hypothetical protein
MNKDLYGNTIPLPENVSEYLNRCFNAAKGADETTEGYKRNKELREKNEITYQQLKRIKNWFDNFNGQPNDLSFILNGGDYMKNWVNETLRGMRDNVEMGKKAKADVLPNQYIQPHEKEGLKNMNRPTKSHSSRKSEYDVRITENLKRINELISKIL